MFGSSTMRFGDTATAGRPVKLFGKTGDEEGLIAGLN